MELKIYAAGGTIDKIYFDAKSEYRRKLLDAIGNDPHKNIVVTHGTDTMVETACELQKNITQKTIIFTGSMAPTRFRGSDATFNVGCAITAAQILPPGVYIAMNGRIFSPEETRKNVPKCCFETV